MSAGRKTGAREGSSKTTAKKRTVDQGRANKLAAFGFTGFVVLMAAAAAIALDIPAKAMTSAGQAIGEAGFKVDGYQIVGLKHMDRKLVDAVVVDELRRAAAPSDEAKPAQPLVDVDRTRERLLQFGWVEDARVSRRLPDTLVIDVVERRRNGHRAGPPQADRLPGGIIAGPPPAREALSCGRPPEPLP